MRGLILLLFCVLPLTIFCQNDPTPDSFEDLGNGTVATGDDIQIGGSLNVADSVYFDATLNTRLDFHADSNGYFGGRLGVGTPPAERLHVKGSGFILEPNYDEIETELDISGEGTRTFIYSPLMAFRGGRVEGIGSDYFDTPNLSQFSFGYGYNVLVRGRVSGAVGDNLIVNSEGAWATGLLNTIDCVGCVAGGSQNFLGDAGQNATIYGTGNYGNSLSSLITGSDNRSSFSANVIVSGEFNVDSLSKNIILFGLENKSINTENGIIGGVDNRMFNGNSGFITGASNQLYSDHAGLIGTLNIMNGARSWGFGTDNEQYANDAGIFGEKNFNYAHRSEVGGRLNVNDTLGINSFIMGLDNHNRNANSLIVGSRNYNDGLNTIIGGLRCYNYAENVIMSGDTVVNHSNHSILVGNELFNDVLGTASGLFGFRNSNESAYSLLSGRDNSNAGIAALIAGLNNQNFQDYAFLFGANNIGNASYASTGGQNNENSGPASDLSGSNRVLIQLLRVLGIVIPDRVLLYRVKAMTTMEQIPLSSALTTVTQVIM